MIAHVISFVTMPFRYMAMFRMLVREADSAENYYNLYLKAKEAEGKKK